MSNSPLLYKIKPATASTDEIVVERHNSDDASIIHVLFCGGFHSSMAGNKAQYLATLCAAEGWGYTCFDYRGHGQSDGLAEDCTLHDWLEDTLAVIDLLPDRVIVVGSSMGAWIGLLASLERPQKVAGLLTIAAAPDFTSRLIWPALSPQQRQTIERGECAELRNNYDDTVWKVRECLFSSGRELSVLDQSEIKLGCPVRLIHGTADTDVPWQFSEELMQKFTSNTDVSLLLLRGGDHRLSDDRALKHISRSLAQLVADL